MLTIMTFSLASLVAGDCDPSEHAKTASTPAAATAAAAGPTTVKSLGAGVTLAEVTKFADLVKTPDKYAGKTVLVEAVIRKVCSKKGCWMEVAESTAAAGQGARVTFKDYGFFMPLDSAGSTVRVQGLVKVEKVAKEKVAHFEAEGATFAAKASDGSARELSLVATGVELKTLAVN